MSQYTSRDFDRPEHLQFVKELEQASPSGSKPFYQLFEDFLTLSALAIAQLVHRMLHAGELDPEMEAEYMRCVGKYEKEKARHFGVAMAIMTKSLQGQPYAGNEKSADALSLTGDGSIHDFLGDVYSRTGIASKWGGQFFTPWPICQLMAKFTLGDTLPEHRITVQEPAVGGGAMLMAVAEDLRGRGITPRRWWFDATDVDLRCARMAYVQLSTIDAPGVVRHGNSLSMQQWGAWLTPAGALYPMRWPKKEAQQVEADIITPSKAAQEEAKRRVDEQMELL